MMKHPLKKVVIVGGGTAGWIAAALLSKLMGSALTIELIESDAIGTIGVGEATIPPIRHLNDALGINEADFLRATRATIKLAIRFDGWHTPGQHYFHAFGAVGQDFAFCPFQHFWLRARQANIDTDLWDYNLNYHCIAANKFAPLSTKDPNLELPYAFHFDANLYAQYLRRYAEQRGVIRTEGLIEQVQRDADSGNVTQLILKNGVAITGELFLDCSGLRGLLINEALDTPFENWSHWLPCDRAVAVPSEPLEKPLPFTRAIAHEFGWQWRIPLQHRNGNGLVYSSEYCSDDEAAHRLLTRLDTTATDEPRLIRFSTGRRVESWRHNVVAIGLSSGFLEPLESTSIHLIQSAVVRLLKLFPHQQIEPAAIAEYNRQSVLEFEQIRDFIILHYHANQRVGEPFWDALRHSDIPHSLAQKIALFRQTGTLVKTQDELFVESSWLQVLIGQGVLPEDYHPMANQVTDTQLHALLNNMKSIKQSPLQQMPGYSEFLAQINNK